MNIEYLAWLLLSGLLKPIVIHELLVLRRGNADTRTFDQGRLLLWP